MELDQLQKVLIVDGCSADRYIMEYYLCVEYEVYSVSTGEQALLALEREEFDCCIINTELPDCTGSDLIKSFHALYGPMAIVLVTGSEDKIKQATLPLVGVTVCLNKELVTQLEMLDAVRSLIQTPTPLVIEHG